MRTAIYTPRGTWAASVGPSIIRVSRRVDGSAAQSHPEQRVDLAGRRPVVGVMDRDEPEVTCRVHVGKQIVDEDTPGAVRLSSSSVVEDVRVRLCASRPDRR